MSWSKLYQYMGGFKHCQYMGGSKLYQYVGGFKHCQYILDQNLSIYGWI